MGEVAARATAVAAGNKLNDLFNSANVATTKTRVDTLRANGFPGLLRKKNGNPPAPARQRTLRFAGWLLTSDVAFIDTDPSKGNFRDWLRWLTWLKKERKTAHNRIRNAIEENMARANPVPMVFRWTPAESEQDFNLELRTPTDFPMDPHYEITVTAKDGTNVHVANDEDDSQNPPEDS